MHAILDRYFSLTKLGTTVRAEIIGGATTFVTMAYIIIVNPKILSGLTTWEKRFPHSALWH